ncbi:MAG: histidine kinase dimerization/phospho-acceptor domain-containing protein, partial [Acidimicrobiales bacterium]
MVELTWSAAVALAGGGVTLVLALLIVAVRARRHAASVNRRLAVVMARLEQPGARPRHERDSIGRLEQLAETSVVRSIDAESARARLAGALAAVDCGVVVCDETGEVVFRNGAAAVVAEITGAEDVVAEVLAAASAGGRPSREVDLFGSYRRLSVSGHPLDDGSRPIGAVALVEDRSEGRRIDTVRQEFLANVTAELRGPVAALDLLAATIAVEHDPGLTRRLAGRLAGEAHRASRVIDDVAELSQLDAGLPPPAGPVPVALLVAEAVEGARSVAGAAAVAVKVAEPDAQVTVVGGRRHLVSALRHL